MHVHMYLTCTHVPLYHVHVHVPASMLVYKYMCIAFLNIVAWCPLIMIEILLMNILIIITEEDTDPFILGGRAN